MRQIARMGLLFRGSFLEDTVAMDRSFPAIEDLKAGDEASWTVAFSYLWPIALHVAKASPGRLSVSDAEEVASDAICLAMQQIARVDSERELRALVAVIARRRAITRLRRNSAGKRVPEGGELEPMDLQLEDPLAGAARPSDPSEDAMQRDTLLLLDRAMSGLDPFTYQLVREKYVAGYSYEELSSRHGIPIGTLCPKVMRALQEIRSAMDGSPELMKELQLLLRR